MRFVLGFVVCLLVIAIGGAAYIYSGAYNIAATDPHIGPVRFVLDVTTRRSVLSRADAAPPADYGSDRMVQAGSQRYEEMCVGCHGAPGVEQGPIGKGLTPSPPDLARAAGAWRPEELFWIVRNGIKMTGMPAWDVSHPEEALWSVVAFVEKLPELSPEQYQAMRARSGQSQGGGRQPGAAGQGGGADQGADGGEQPARQRP